MHNLIKRQNRPAPEPSGARTVGTVNERATAPRVNARQPRKKRALIVDDSRMVRRLSREILQSHGFEVSEAENGEEALARIASGPMPDLITLDWNMPVMSGLDTLKALRAKFDDQVPHIMFCTTNNEISDIHKGVEAGASEWIVKPFDKASLTAKLSKIGAI